MTREKVRLYLDLIRWDRPAGWLLLLWPSLYALWIAADGFPGWHLVAVFTLGTVLMRSAGCCHNDVADREFDRHVKRTAQRPVTTGAVSVGEALADDARDHHFGRRMADNEEIEDAPESAHVKRTTQESFDPEAFVLRRSMPWMMSMQAGLMFVAFGKSFDAFEAQMRRMAGYDDDITDALFKISKPVTGAYFWCPPMRDGRLDLRQLGL